MVVNTNIALPTPCSGYETLGGCSHPNVYYENDIIPKMRALTPVSPICNNCHLYLDSKDLDQEIMDLAIFEAIYIQTESRLIEITEEEKVEL